MIPDGYPCPPLDARFPRSLVRRIERTDLPLSALGAVREMRDYLDAVERECIVKARTLGASPTEIGQELGLTRQAVYKKLSALLKLRGNDVDAAPASEPSITRPA